MSFELGGKNAGIVFADAGRGMTPEQVERLFEPFTSSTTGGKVIGYASNTTGPSSVYDRSLYLDNTGAFAYGSIDLICESP